MSLYGEWKAATITDTDSSAIDLGWSWDFLEIQIPTLVSCTIKIQVAEKLADTYRDLGDGITTAAGIHNYHDVFKLGGWRYVKVIASTGQGGAKAIRVRGMRY